MREAVATGSATVLDTAKGSIYEVAAVLDVAQAFGVLPAEMHAHGHELCDHLAAMLGRFR